MHPIHVACTLVLLVVATDALALKSDRDKPLDVAADSLETTEGQARTTLSGNVRIKQGTLEVESDKAVVSRGKNDEIDRAVLTGRPATLEQDLDDGGRMKARAREIDYDLARDTVVLTGDVVVDQPRGELRGSKVTYEMATGKLTGASGDTGRVHLRMNPQQASKDGT
ncbi:MAG TPA: lipopolysaccharide transport periplasmic protein LptA [Candidatus Saccharimonadia bacterium]|nr:lipopolysaccharide transport periplasmic protein LptA [Candidatus Saccharimonadia bacterium]